MSKVHIDTSVLELGQKALLRRRAQRGEELGLRGKARFAGDGDLSLFACSYFTGNWLTERTGSRILGRCSGSREIGFQGSSERLRCCVMGGTAVTPAGSSPFPKRFHGLRGLGQTCSSFSSFIGGQVRECFIS